MAMIVNPWVLIGSVDPSSRTEIWVIKVSDATFVRRIVADMETVAFPLAARFRICTLRSGTTETGTDHCRSAVTGTDSMLVIEHAS